MDLVEERSIVDPPYGGRPHELINGMLHVFPVPDFDHQIVLGALYRLLWPVCPAELVVVIAPFTWRIGEYTFVRPDLLVARRNDILAVEGRTHLSKPPVLAVEVRSPTSGLYDRSMKRSVYQDEGVASYWLVDPDLDGPSLTVLELVDGSYQEVVRLTGEERWTVGSPFPVELCPAYLVAELRD